jgi:Flp pilus assembly protein TadD, contains TPR repeats
MVVGGEQMRKHNSPLPLLLLLVLLAPPHAGCAEKASDWADAYEKAAQILRSGDIATAERTFQSLWQANPRDPKLANAIGAALNAAGKPDEAAPWYKRAIKLNPAFAPAYNNLGLNYASRGMLEQATGPLRKACQLDPKNVRAFYNLGLVLIQRRRYVEAAGALERAHELSPEMPDPLVRLAYADFRAGHAIQGRAAVDALLKLPGDRQARVLEAIKLLNSLRRYEDVLRLVRDSSTAAATPELHVHEAEALLGLSRYNEVVSLLEGRLPNNGPADGYLLLGSAQALQGNLSAAVATLQTAVRLDPGSPDGYYRLGLVFLAGFREAEAQEAIDTGLQAVPNSTLLLNGLASVLDVRAKRPEAIQALERSVEIDPQQEEAWGQLGALYSQTGQAGKALAAYSRALRLGASAESYSNFIDYLIRLGRFDEAEKVAAEGLAKHPASGELHYEFGKLQRRRGNLVAAERALRQAVSLNLVDASVHYLLAGVLQRLGKADEAAAEFKLTKEMKSEERQRKVLRTRLIPAAETREDAFENR